MTTDEHGFWGAPPQGDLSISELREYIRPKKRIMSAPRPVEQKQKTTPFEQRFRMSPRDFLREAKGDRRWNDKGTEALELAEEGRLHQDDLMDLAEAYFDFPDPGLQVTPEKPKHQGAAPPRRVSFDKWWSKIDLPRINGGEPVTSAVEASTVRESPRHADTSPAASESELGRLAAQLLRIEELPETK